MTILTNELAVSRGTSGIAADSPDPIPTNFVGGAGGVPFPAFIDPAGISQLIVKPLTDTRTGQTFITQITVVNSDGTITKSFGQALGDTAPMQLDLSSDAIKTCQLCFSTFDSGRLGGIIIETVKGQKFEPGDISGAIDLTADGNSNVENFYIVGVYGNAGLNIDRLGFFLAEDAIVRRVLKDFTYDRPEPPIPTPVALNTIIVENRSNEPQTPSISFTEDVASTSEWGNVAGITLGVEATLETGIPFVAEGAVSVSVEGSYQYSWGGSLTTSLQFHYEAPVLVAANSKISASAIVQRSKLALRFKAIYEVERVHTGIAKQEINGTYSGVTAYDVDVQYDNLPEPSS